MSLSLLDVILLFVFFIVASHAAFRGLVAELTGAAWLVIGFLFSFSFYREGAAFIRTKMLSRTEYIPEAMAFFTLFLIAFIAIKILGGMLKEIIQSVGLGLPDKILGLGFGIIKGIIVIGFILFIIRVQPLVNGEKVLQGSMINRILSPNIEKVRQTMEELKENLDV